MREQFAENIVPKDKKVHLKGNFIRDVNDQTNTVFPFASIPAKRNLRKIIEEEASQDVFNRPNLGLPPKVHGAV